MVTPIVSSPQDGNSLTGTEHLPASSQSCVAQPESGSNNVVEKKSKHCRGLTTSSGREGTSSKCSSEEQTDGGSAITKDDKCLAKGSEVEDDATSHSDLSELSKQIMDDEENMQPMAPPLPLSPPMLPICFVVQEIH